MAELRRRFVRDPQRLNEEIVKLFREHRTSPWSPLSGLLIVLLQLFTGWVLYQGFDRPAVHLAEGRGLLWIHDVTRSATSTGMAAYPAGFVFPLVAAMTEMFHQVRGSARVGRLGIAADERTTRMRRSTLFLGPAMVFFLGLNLPQALSIFWVGQLVVMIAERSRYP